MKGKIIDYIDFTKFSALLEDFSKFTGFVTAILDLDGNVLSQSGWRKICTEFHRVHPETCKNCAQSDTVLANANNKENFNVYKCMNGLYDVAVPINIEGEHVANLFTGQLLFENPDFSYFSAQAKQYGFDEEVYLKALDEVPIVTVSQVKEVVNYLTNILKIIIDLTTDKIAHINSKILLESSLESPKNIIILALDTNYNYLYYNQAHKDIMKNIYHQDIKVNHNLLNYIGFLEDKSKTKKNYQLALSGITHSTIEEYGDEHKRYFESWFNPIFDDKKNIIGCTAFATDITKITEANKKLEESYDRLDRSQQLANSGSWELDLASNLIWASQEAFRIYELPKDSEYIDISKIEKMVSEEDRLMLNQALLNLVTKGEAYDVHFALHTVTQIKFIHSKADITLDSLGKPIKVLGVIRDITELKEKEEELMHLSYHDSLTGLYNRRYYEEQLIKLDVPQNLPLTVVMSDINGLKLINDAFGHTAGDKLLSSAAKLISDCSRESDLVARIGGDEFVILLPNTSGAEAEALIDKINQKAKEIKIESIALSISFGFKTKKDINEDIYETYRTAEDLMYRVKLIEIPSMRGGAISTILNTLNEKDKSSEIHSRTVSSISERLATAFGMDRQEVNEVKTAGLLHDIGKIIIPISIITKKGKLTVEEYELIKGHPEIGFRILNSTHDMRNISKIVLNHHERWDGFGYPRGISSDDIPIQSRIIAIADAFDAMTSERTYRKVLSNAEALEEIITNAGTQFDPVLAQVFSENFKSIITK